MNKLRVLVFGATGTGKTSVCNALSGKSGSTGNGARGVTAQSKEFEPFEAHGQLVELIDTVGLHEASTGTVPAERAIAQLVDLLAKSEQGFNLLVHVARATRLTREHEEDYQFFVDRMTGKKVPVILVLTGCENEQPMSTWLDSNHSAFEKYEYRQIVPSCFANGGALEQHYAPLRHQSRTEVQASILRHALPAPVRLYGPGTATTFEQALIRLWNEFVDWAGLPAEYRRRLNESAYGLLRRLGVPEKIAEMAIKHLPDVAEELGSKLPIPGAGKAARFGVRAILERIRRTVATVR